MTGPFRFIVREVVGCALLAVGVAAAACTSLTGSSAASTTINTYSPLTGIEVDAAGLFAREGCGTAPGVPYKYVVEVFGTVAGLDGGPIYAALPGLYDCFSDAVFVNLTASAALGGTTSFNLTVLAFDANTYDINARAINDAVNEVDDSDGGVGVIVELADLANWSTTCTATQEPNIQSLAACGPLAATGH